jgi:NB-ARC domain
VRKWNINWGYLVAAILLAAAGYVASLAFFPEWAQSLKLLVGLAVLVIVGVFAFLASLRGILENGATEPGGGTRGPVTVAGNDHVAGTKIVEQHAGADLVGRDKITTLNAGRDAISAQQVQINQPAEVGTLGLHQLPSAPRDFTGRVAELGDVYQAIREQGVTIVGLRGLGGVGKTALALVLAHELKKDYPDAQIFLDLQGVTKPFTPDDVMVHVIRAYQPVAKLSDDPDELAAQYRSVFHSQRALVLLDNVASGAQVEHLIPPPGSFLLITSRSHFVLPGLRAIDIDSLPPTDAEALLLKICPRIGSHADELAKRCGYLPLALRLAASALAERKNLGLVTYIRFLQAEHSRLKTLEKVEASLALSYNLLSSELQQLWCLLAVFPVDFDDPAAAAVWQLDADTVNSSLSDLLRFSLLEFDPAVGRYHLHDLARDFAQLRLNDAERAGTQRRHAVYYRGLLAVAEIYRTNGDENMSRARTLFGLDRANILAARDWAAAHASDDEAAAQLKNDYAPVEFYVFNAAIHSAKFFDRLEASFESMSEEDKSALKEVNESTKRLVATDNDSDSPHIP